MLQPMKCNLHRDLCKSLFFKLDIIHAIIQKYTVEHVNMILLGVISTRMSFLPLSVCRCHAHPPSRNIPTAHDSHMFLLYRQFLLFQNNDAARAKMKLEEEVHSIEELMANLSQKGAQLQSFMKTLKPEEQLPDRIGMNFSNVERTLF